MIETKTASRAPAALATTAAFALTLVLSSCSYPDWANPIEWYRDATGVSQDDPDGTEPNAKNLEKGSEDPYPSVGTVPAPPTNALSSEEREQLKQSLVSDRANAKYVDNSDQYSATAPQAVAGPVTHPGIFDPVIGRPIQDGLGGARNDLTWAPAVDIANGAPTGADATNRIVMTYVTGTTDSPHVQFTESADGGATFSTPRNLEAPGDFGYYTAPAISPDGTDVYVVYNAFTTPYQPTTATARGLVGVVLHADVTGGSTGSFSQIHRGVTGDPRGSSQNGLTAEFLGDYVYAAATRTYGAAVWNDTRNAAVCPAINTYRQLLRTNPAAAVAPNVPADCPAAFGNSDIFGGSFPDPTP